MLKIYHEHPEFDEFTQFDTATGQLKTLSQNEFHLKSQDTNIKVFDGECPETHVRFPRRVYFQITRNCNLFCDYCFIKSKTGEPHVPTKAIFSLAKMLGKSGLMEVRLTGGEPTSHPDFLDIMHKFKEEGIYVSVATNGIWHQKTVEALCNEPYLWVITSIDGNRDTHNRYRPGTFDQIIKNLQTLKKRNPTARIRLTTVLTQENKNQMLALGEIGASVEAESITVIPLRPQVREASMKELMVKGAEFKVVIEDLIKAKKRYGIPFTTTMETDYKENIFKDPIVRKRSSCAAGREATNLDYDALCEEFVVYACSYSPASDLLAHPNIRKPFLAGSFSSQSVDRFGDIWRNEKVWRIYRDLSIRSQHCKNCSYLKKHQCTGSCPIQNIDYSAINVEQDVLDQLRSQITKTGEWYCYQKIFD